MPEDVQKPQEEQPQNQPSQSGEQNQPQLAVDIDAEVQKRLDEFAKALGFESADDMQMKILEEAGKYEEVKEKLKQEVQTWKQKYQEAVLRSEVMGKATQMGVVDPELLMNLIKDKAQITDDGRVLVNGKPLEEFLNELREKKPYLFAQPKGGSGATHSGIQTSPDLASLPPEERLKVIFAKKLGIK
jgi:hypothetical protein